MVDTGSFFFGLSVGAIVIVVAAWRPLRRGLRVEGGSLVSIDWLRQAEEEIKKLKIEASKMRTQIDRQRPELAKLNRAIRKRNARLSRRKELLSDVGRCEYLAGNAEATSDGVGQLSVAVGHVLGRLLNPVFDRTDDFPMHYFFGLYSRESKALVNVIANGDLSTEELCAEIAAVAVEINQEVELDRYRVGIGGGSKREGTPANDAAGPRVAASSKVGEADKRPLLLSGESVNSLTARGRTT